MSYKINEDQYFVHFKDDGESAFILNYDDSASDYFQLTGFASDVVSFILKHQGCSLDDIHKELAPMYDSSESDFKSELNKVMGKLSEHNVI